MLTATLVGKVGTAPATTTMRLRNSRPWGSWQAHPYPSVAERNQAIAAGQPAGQPAARPATYYSPYASIENMLGAISEVKPVSTGRDYGQNGTTTMFEPAGLGVVFPGRNEHLWVERYRQSPHTAIASVRGGEVIAGAGLGITNSEIARSLTGLGAIPTDDELSVAYGGQYTPYHSGWIYGTTTDGKRFYTPTLYGAGLGQAAGPSGAAAQADPAKLEEMVRLQRRQTTIQMVSTIAIALLAGVAIVTAIVKR